MSDPESRNVVVILTVGKSDNGKAATMAFSCGLSAMAMGHQPVVFLTSDGAVWGYRESCCGNRRPRLPPLSELMRMFLDGGGRVILCSVCLKTCSVGSPDNQPTFDTQPEVEIGGFATVLELAMGGVSVTF